MKKDNMNIHLKTHLKPVTIGLIMILSLVSAQSYFSLVVPPSFGSRSTQSLSLGMTGTATSTGPDNLWTNPAMLHTDNRFSVTVNGSLRRFDEKRAYPVYDMFDDVAMINTYAANRHWYSDVDGGLLISLPKNAVLGLARSVFWDFTYDYAEEVRGSLPSGTYNRDPLRGYHEINRSGKIISTDIGLSVPVFSGIKWGIGVHLLDGRDIQDRYGITVLDPDDALASDSTFIRESEITLDESSTIYTTGIAFTPKNGLTIGMSYQSGTEIILKDLWSLPEIDEWTLLPGYKDLTSIEETGYAIMTLPEKLTIGVDATLANPIVTKAVMEVHYCDWSDFEQAVFYPDTEELTEVPYTFQETWEIHGGIEHVFQNKIPFRFGFVYSESPLGQEFETTKITAGSAYRWGKAVFDFGMTFGSVQYYYPDLFRAVSEELEVLDQVKESNITAAFSLTYEL